MKKLLNFLADMNVGDTAEFPKTPFARIRREEDGYYWVRDNGDYNNGSKENSTFKLANIEHLPVNILKILPKYVSFEEVVEAYKQGKTVCLHDGERKSKFQRDLTEESFTLMNMVYGTWTIEN